MAEEIILPNSPLDAANFFYDKWNSVPKHLAFINKKLLEIIKQGNGKLLLNMPPRHGKSLLCSKYLPFYFLANNPTKHIILSSYESSFAELWGRRVRDAFKIYGSAMNINLKKDAAAVGHFQLEQGGSMTAVGAGGSITGRGADLFIIDDPIKNDEQANSQTQRDNLWEWFCTTAFTRLEPNATIIIVMTRWHEDDICGRLIKRQDELNKDRATTERSNERWEVLSFPALATHNDLLGRPPNTALWASRFGTERLQQIRQQIGEYWFNALYQQTPSIAEGHIFKQKNFRYFYEDGLNYVLLKKSQKTIIVKNSCPIFATIDLAVSTSETADYTAVVIAAITPDADILVLDVIRQKFDATKHLPLLRDIYKKWNPKTIGIESVQYQLSLIQMARSELIPVKPLLPDKDKVSRALPIAATMEAEKVFFKQNAIWLYDFEQELLNFPKGKNDDQADAFAYLHQVALPLLHRMQPIIVVANRTPRVTDFF